MKLKKFFAGVLAAAMMLTVGATAALAGGGGLLIRLQPRLLILLQVPLLWIAR